MRTTARAAVELNRGRLPWRWPCAPDSLHTMRRSTGLMRAFTRITILLQLLLPTVVSIADARLERDAMAARAYSHVEANTGQDCARAHKADCALCQHLTTPGTKASKPAMPVSTGRTELPACSLDLARVTADARRPSLARAPPTA